MKCKNCKYYTGIKCHGHGDFWGNCKLIDGLETQLDEIIDKKDIELENTLSKLGYKDEFISKVTYSYFTYICDDDDDCKFKKFVDDMYSRGIINDKYFKHLSKKDSYKQCECNSFVQGLFDALDDVFKSIFEEEKDEK